MEAATGHARFGSAPGHPTRSRSGTTSTTSTAGFWAVVAEFEGRRHGGPLRAGGPAPPPTRRRRPGRRWRASGRTSLDHAAYLAGVGEIRERIAAGTVYQVNLCRVLSHELPEEADLDGLARLLERGNPAPHAGRVAVPSAGLDVVCASPEAFLLRDGDRLESRPDQGHGDQPRGDAAQGLRRERHDRRPGAQRPVARLPRGDGAGRPPVPSRGAPGPGPPRVRRLRAAASRESAGPR